MNNGSDRDDPLKASEIVLQGDTCIEQNSELYKLGFTDGLPVVLPTPERVGQMLDEVAHLSLPPRFGRVPPTQGVATLEGIAIQATMAGCDWQHLPVVCAATSAVTDEVFNLSSVQSTTHPAAPLCIVNGSIRHSLEMNSGAGCFGSGNRANAVIGRALRLVLHNIGAGKPGAGDRATHGQPGKYSYCIAENEEESPWEALSFSRGIDCDSSAVTVLGGEAPHNIQDHVSERATGVLTNIAQSMTTVAKNNLFHPKIANILVVLGPEHANTISDGGFSRRGVMRFLYEHARVSISKARLGGMWGMHNWPVWYEEGSSDGRVPIVSSFEQFIVAVAGGPGKHSCWVPTLGTTVAVTKPIVKS